MNEVRKLILEIESLALHGLPRAGARSLVAALERELGRLLAEPERRARWPPRRPARAVQARACRLLDPHRDPTPREWGGHRPATFGALAGGTGRRSPCAGIPCRRAYRRGPWSGWIRQPAGERDRLPVQPGNADA